MYSQLVEYKRRNDALADALERGEFEQGRDKLRNGDDTYCCLGVGCNVFERLTGRGKWVSTPGGFEFEVNGDHEHLYPPREVRLWFGWMTRDPKIVIYGATKVYATDANDSKRYTFADIAKGFRRMFGG